MSYVLFFNTKKKVEVLSASMPLKAFNSTNVLNSKCSEHIDRKFILVLCKSYQSVFAVFIQKLAIYKVHCTHDMLCSQFDIDARTNLLNCVQISTVEINQGGIHKLC